MISTIPPGRCIQTQGTEPFQYGPEVYRSYWRLSSALEHWLALVAQRDPEVIVEEGGAPAAKDIAELMELHRSIGLWLFEGHHYNVLNVRLLHEAVEAGRKWQKGLPWRTYVIDRTDDLRCAVEAYEDCRNNPGAVVRSSTALVPLAPEVAAGSERLAHLYVPPNDDLPYPPAVYRAFRRFAEGVQDWMLAAKAGTLAQDRPSEAEQAQFSTWYCTTNLWLFYPKDARADFYASELDAFKKMLAEGRTWARSIESREQVIDLLESIIQTIEAYPLSKSSAVPLTSEAPAASNVSSCSTQVG